MKLNEIIRIKQTADETQVNDFLDKGYRIIKIFSSKIIIDGQDLIQPIYILGISYNNENNRTGVLA